VTTDPCRDWRGAIGAAALGRGDPAEEIGLRAHLEGCAECRAALQELTEVAGALGAVPVEGIVRAPAEPSSELAARVLERVARERDALRGRRTRRLVAGTTAFATAAAAVVALVLAFGGSDEPSGTRVSLRGVGGAQASVTLHAQSVGTAIDMQISNLRSDEYYWLWLTGANKRRLGAGTFRGSNKPTDLHLTAALPLSKARRIWVTDERDRIVLDAFLPSDT
jgi:anti-sigma factor RsiW